MLISELHKKKILILGLGEEGIDNLLFCKKNVSLGKLGVADILPYEKIDIKKRKHLTEDVNLYLGEDYLSATEKYDVVIKSPGVPFSAIRKKEGVTSQSDIFLSNCKGRVIGVTGTKGKSTTSTILNETLCSAGFRSHLIGNIGKPALHHLGTEKKDDFFVYELSSFQLQTVTKSPSIAILLNIFVDHLDKHQDFKEYVDAKKRITLFQKSRDFFIYNEEDKCAQKIAEETAAQKIPFSPIDPLNPISKVMEIFKIENHFLASVIRDFRGLPHRTEYLGSYRGVSFYNDSAATIPEATIKAIRDVKNVQTIILGGSDKGVDISGLLDTLKSSDIQNIILFKGSTKKLEKELKYSGKPIFFVGSMKEAVKRCFQNTDRGKACLLSPGFASFNMFKNYRERGELFKKYVRCYKNI